MTLRRAAGTLIFAALLLSSSHLTSAIDDPPKISIDDAAIPEGNSGVSLMYFSVHLSRPSTQAVSVAYATRDYTALRASDFVETSGTLVFAPGEILRTIAVVINGDTEAESDEVVQVQLGAYNGVSVGRFTASGVIQDDDVRKQGAWAALPTFGAPEGRERHVAVWTGTKMFIWGGWQGSTERSTNTGGLYDPATDSWSPISMSGAPQARTDASAVWTGTKVIVWGGATDVGVANTGGIYDPVTDTWSGISTAGAPAARLLAAAVWTGTRMIVWGGYGQFASGSDYGYLDTGAIYDPATNAWTPMSQAPSGRSGFAYVWTGTKLLVWGGVVGTVSANNVTDSGAAYDPTTNTWQAMTTVGAPSARHSSVGVWTGDRFLVWGGFGYVGDFSAGGSYDPIQNVWSSIPPALVPIPQYTPTAVWTGSSMLVWGMTGNIVNTGQTFDPQSRTWASITTVGAPPPQEGHKAIWTGTSMIPWGGVRGGNGTVNTGGIFKLPIVSRMVSPAPATSLAGSSVTFEWDAGTLVDEYWLSIGNSVGASDLYNGSTGTSRSRTVTGLPQDGRTLYVVLWSRAGSTWLSNSYTYSALDPRAGITSPSPGSTLSGSSVIFQWSAGTSATEYWLSIGNSVGSYDVYNGTQALNRSFGATGLPTDGRNLYLRLWTLSAGAWLFRDFSFTALNIPPTKAVMTGPAPGSTLSGSTVTFQWNAGTSIQEYWLSVGTTPGATNLFSATKGPSLSHTMTGLPLDGKPLYVVLWSRSGTTWLSNSYTYVAFDPASAMTSPAGGSLLGGPSATFQWSAGTGISEYWLSIGAAPGDGRLYTASQGTSRSISMSTLPVDGRTLFVRLWSRSGSSWMYRDYQYQAAGTSAALTTPPPGSTLSGATVTFSWTPGTGNSEYWFTIGSSPGVGNIFTGSTGTNLSYTATGLPTDGRSIYVTLWSRSGTTWLSRNFSLISGS